MDEKEGPPWKESRAEQFEAALRLVRGAQGGDPERVRARLWSIVRAPIARLLRSVPGMTHEAVEELAAVGRSIVPVCGLDWQQAYLNPAASQIPEPRAWEIA